jgi:hypothetical protein
MSTRPRSPQTSETVTRRPSPEFMRVVHALVDDMIRMAQPDPRECVMCGNHPAITARGECRGCAGGSDR